MTQQPAKKLLFLFIAVVSSIFSLGVILLEQSNNWNIEFLTDVKGIYTNQENVYKVTRIVDGDTIELENGMKVRYIGIDTPETHGKEECFGKEAKRKNSELVLNKLVRLEKDVNESDRYGRLLRYVYVISNLEQKSMELNEIFVNKHLVEMGYARAVSYPPDIKYQEILQIAEKTARENSNGLWNICI